MRGVGANVSRTQPRAATGGARLDPIEPSSATQRVPHGPTVCQSVMMTPARLRWMSQDATRIHQKCNICLFFVDMAGQLATLGA